MRYNDLGKKLRKLPLNKMRGEFKNDLLNKLKLWHESPLLKRPKQDVVLALNSVLLIIILGVILILYLPPAKVKMKVASLQPNQTISELIEPIYSKKYLNFWTSLMKIREYNYVYLKEVKL